MKVLRGPQTTASFTETGTKPASQVEAEWVPGKIFWLDGTIDKTGTRHTDIGVEIGEADVIALASAFLRQGSDRRVSAVGEVTAANARLEAAEAVIRKIYLLAWEAKRAPTKQAFGEAVRAIIQHYEAVARDPHAKIEPPELGWIKWNSL